MYMVYWMEGCETDSLAPGIVWEPMNQAYDATEMSDALKFLETLRTRQRDGARIKFVTFVAENPDQVGHNGVTAVENGKTPDGQPYDWKKRRV